MRTKPFLLLAMLLALGNVAPGSAADLGARLPAAPTEATGVADRLVTLSNLLSLLLVRATFDVVAIEDVPGLLKDRIVAWGSGAPSDGEQAEIERLLLAEASYYIVSLRYLIEVGGAAFPTDRAESGYANDTLVRLDSLERSLAEKLALHEDVAAILREVEAIRLLTEGSAELTSGDGVFSRQEQLLEMAAKLARQGTPT